MFFLPASASSPDLILYIFLRKVGVRGLPQTPGASSNEPVVSMVEPWSLSAPLSLFTTFGGFPAGSPSVNFSSHTSQHQARLSQTKNFIPLNSPHPQIIKFFRLLAQKQKDFSSRADTQIRNPENLPPNSPIS